ncbi:uncharacterized protein [Diadema setosum]|uniref:uncharacterized protein n=1 Tax=Diadema setosum TaxID=31175 RepID=UPI003B3B3A3C
MSIQKTIIRGHHQQLRYLLRDCTPTSLNDRDSAGNPPLITCAIVDDESWSCRVARILLHHGADVNVTDSKRKSALMHACLIGRLKLARSLIKYVPDDQDLDIAMQDDDGETALHHAVRNGSIELVELLIQHCHDRQSLLNLENDQGDTALDFSLLEGKLDIAVRLLEGGGTCGKKLSGLRRLDVMVPRLRSEVEKEPPTAARDQNESSDAETCAKIDESCLSKANKPFKNGNQSPSLRYASQSSPLWAAGRQDNRRLEKLFKVKSVQSTKSFYKPAARVELTNIDKSGECVGESSRQLGGRRSRISRVTSPWLGRLRRSGVTHSPASLHTPESGHSSRRLGRRPSAPRRLSETPLLRHGTTDIDDYQSMSGCDDPGDREGDPTSLRSNFNLLQADLGSATVADDQSLNNAFDGRIVETDVDYNEISVRVPNTKFKHSDRKYGGFIETIPEIDSCAASVFDDSSSRTKLPESERNNRHGRQKSIQNDKHHSNGLSSRYLNPGRRDTRLFSASSNRSTMTWMSNTSTGRSMLQQKKAQIKTIFGRSYEGPNRLLDIENRIKELQEELSWMDRRRKTRGAKSNEGKNSPPSSPSNSITFIMSSSDFRSTDHKERGIDGTLSQNLSSGKSNHFDGQSKCVIKTTSSEMDKFLKYPANNGIGTTPDGDGEKHLSISRPEPEQVRFWRRTKSAPSKSHRGSSTAPNLTDDDRDCDSRALRRFLLNIAELGEERETWRRFHSNPLNNIPGHHRLILERPSAAASRSFQAKKMVTRPERGFGLPKK